MSSLAPKALRVLDTVEAQLYAADRLPQADRRRVLDALAQRIADRMTDEQIASAASYRTGSQVSEPDDGGPRGIPAEIFLWFDDASPNQLATLMLFTVGRIRELGADELFDVMARLAEGGKAE